MTVRNFYAFAEIDRAGHRRRDAAWLNERILDPSSRLLPVWRNQNLVHAAAEPPRAALLLPHEPARRYFSASTIAARSSRLISRRTTSRSLPSATSCPWNSPICAASVR